LFSFYAAISSEFHKQPIMSLDHTGRKIMIWLSMRQSWPNVAAIVVLIAVAIGSYNHSSVQKTHPGVAKADVATQEAL
jgi:hypothetical protein